MHNDFRAAARSVAWNKGFQRARDLATTLGMTGPLIPARAGGPVVPQTWLAGIRRPCDINLSVSYSSKPTPADTKRKEWAEEFAARAQLGFSNDDVPEEEEAVQDIVEAIGGDSQPAAFDLPAMQGTHQPQCLSSSLSLHAPTLPL